MGGGASPAVGAAARDLTGTEVVAGQAGAGDGGLARRRPDAGRRAASPAVGTAARDLAGAEIVAGAAELLLLRRPLLLRRRPLLLPCRPLWRPLRQLLGCRRRRDTAPQHERRDDDAEQTRKSPHDLPHTLPDTTGLAPGDGIAAGAVPTGPWLATTLTAAVAGAGEGKQITIGCSAAAGFAVDSRKKYASSRRYLGEPVCCAAEHFCGAPITRSDKGASAREVPMRAGWAALACGGVCEQALQPSDPG